MLQISSILYFYKKNQFILLFVVSYVFTALGFLSKGLPSVAAQFVTLLFLGIYGKCFRKLFSLKHFLGIFIFLLIVGGYLVIYSRKADTLTLLINFFSESGKRFSPSNGFLDILMQLVYLPQRLLGSLLLPWSLVLVFLFRKSVRKILAQSWSLKFLIWLVIGNTFFYFLAPDYHTRYLYPFLPFMFIILAKIYTSGNEYNFNVLKIICISLLAILSIGSISLLFIPDFQSVDYIIAKSVVFSLLFLVIVIATVKYKLNYFVGLFLGMIIIRLIVNLVYLPSQQGSGLFSFKMTAEKILTITQNEPVYLTGEPYEYNASLGIGPIVIPNTEVTLSVPPMIPYQIPYYITKSTGGIMEYTTNLELNNFYLARVNSLPSEDIEILYQFDDNFLGFELALFKLRTKNNENSCLTDEMVKQIIKK
jgi:hypothetical protein